MTMLVGYMVEMRQFSKEWHPCRLVNTRNPKSGKWHSVLRQNFGAKYHATVFPDIKALERAVQRTKYHFDNKKQTRIKTRIRVLGTPPPTRAEVIKRKAEK